MLLTGRNLTQANDLLQKTTIEQVYNTIKNPPHDLRAKINQLRIVLSLDNARYRALKTILPYFTCGIFQPPYRKTENFGYIERFILDYDNLSGSDITPEKLRTMLVRDQRVEMMFVSPSGNGLKVMFRLSEKCYDRVKFRMFYKIFIRSFSAEYGITMVADSRNSDVTRACFMSVDENAWYNPEAVPVQQSAYIDFSSPEQLAEANRILKEEKENIKTENREPQGQEIDPDILYQIKKKLKPDIRTRREKIIYVPGELENIVSKIKVRMEEFGIEMKSVENIHYGKKFVFELGLRWAEINVFYGKKGFSVVKTPKRGSNEELADISHKIICELLI